jgi:hypothetical protein
MWNWVKLSKVGSNAIVHVPVGAGPNKIRFRFQTSDLVPVWFCLTGTGGSYLPKWVPAQHCFNLTEDQSEPAPTSAPTWMDGALIGFSFLSMCHPRLTFFVCPFQPWSALISVFFFWELYFLLTPHPVSFFFCFWNFFHQPTYYPALSPTDLFTYIFKLKVDSSPSTYSPINLKCATLIATHLPTLPPSYLPTL